MEKIKELEAALAEKKRRINDLEGDNKKLFELEEEVGSLKLSHYSSDEKSKSSLDGMRIQYEVAQIEIAQLKQEIEENKTDFLKQIETDKKNAEEKIEELKAQLEEFVVDKNTKEATLVEMKKELETTQSQLTTELESTAKDYIQQINSIISDKEQLEKQLEEVKKSKSALTETIEQLETEKKKLNENLNRSEESVKDAIEKLKEENKKLSEDLKSARTEVEVLGQVQTQLNTIEEQLKVQNDHVATLSKEKEDLLVQMKTIREANEKLVADSQQANETIKDASEKQMTLMNEEKLRLQNSVDDLTSQMQSLSTGTDFEFHLC